MRVSVLPVAVVTGLLGAGLTWAAFTGAAGAPEAPGGTASVAEGPTARVERHGARARSEQPGPPVERRGGVSDRISGLVLPESEPTGVYIPRLGVRSNLATLTLDGAGEMEVPVDPAVAGWYALGPSPGALGPAVIAGHVTWDQAPAVFFALRSLQRGDVVKVARADGSTAVFAVQGVRTVAKDRFPTDEVFGTIDHAGLRLITCGGAYDHAAQRYLGNVVVFATLVDVRPVEG